MQFWRGTTYKRATSPLLGEVAREGEYELGSVGGVDADAAVGSGDDGQVGGDGSVAGVQGGDAGYCRSGCEQRQVAKALGRNNGRVKHIGSCGGRRGARAGFDR